jgi:hypothetical protein
MLSVYGAVTESKVLLDQNGTSKGGVFFYLKNTLATSIFDYSLLSVGLARMIDNNSAKNAIAQLNSTNLDFYI